MTLFHYDLFTFTGIASYCGMLLAPILLYSIGTIIRNVFFSPLRHVPGPRLAAASGIPYSLQTRSGNIVSWLNKLHAKYGDAVRVGPNEVSFISGETAYPDIYGFRTGKYKNTGAYLKDPAWFAPPVNGVWSIVVSGEADHSRMRRSLSYAFSDKALREQEQLVMGYVDLLINRLTEQAEKGISVDIMRWYNFITFDVITDLAFGEPLYCLRDNKYHEWVNLVVRNTKSLPIFATQNKYLLFRYYDKFRNLFVDTQAHVRARKEFFDLAQARVTSRLNSESTRPDFFTYILQNQEKENKALTRAEMDSNAVVFLIAGSETTATALSGTTFLLLRNKAAYTRLVAEIRSTFKSSADINIDAGNNIPYLLAVLQEGLRYYPPVATGFPRVVPGQGQEISGHYISGGTTVYVSQYPANHSARNFVDPDAFVPERWLDERPSKYDDDKREVVQPFNIGPRNCLGKNLAYAEMRLILAKIIWHFDLELVRPEEDWIGTQKLFGHWEKPSLDVKLTPVQRDN